MITEYLFMKRVIVRWGAYCEWQIKKQMILILMCNFCNKLKKRRTQVFFLIRVGRPPLMVQATLKNKKTWTCVS